MRSATTLEPGQSRIGRSFNPRTPCGVRRSMSNVMGTVIMFQSTHSLRSATPTGDVPLRFEAVSIHALLAECDLEGESEPCHIFGFNPRTPCGVRHNAGGLHMSIFRVSIHALLAECDINDLLQCKGKRSFNPRTPCGVRLASLLYATTLSLFQSTHSLRSATAPDHIHCYSTAQTILCANLPKKAIIT